MTIRDRLSRAAYSNPVAQLYAWAHQTFLTTGVHTSAQDAATHRQLLDTLLGYYFSNGVYEELQINTGGDDITKSIRNPVAAFTGFYEAKLWADPLTPLPKTKGETRKANLIALIQEIWARSKWDDNKDLAAFRLSLYGEMELKAAQREDGQPYLQTLDPRFITEIERTDRGFVTWCRIDTPTDKRDPETGKVESVMITQVWEPTRYRQWESKKDVSTSDLSQLPREHYEERVFDNRKSEDGLLVDFVPIAFTAFKAVDLGRGFSPVLLALEDIDEANQQATRLHAMYFRNEENTIVVESNHISPTGQAVVTPLGDAGKAKWIELPNGTRLMNLPGNATAKFLVPPLNYEQGLSMLNAQLKAIRELKLPELNYYVTDDNTSDESGKSRWYRMGPALERALKTRGRSQDCLARGTRMCITMGQSTYLSLKARGKDASAFEKYSPEKIGTYQAGDWDFDFAPAEILPLTQQELMEIEEARSRTVKGYVDASAPLEGAAKVAGLTQAQVDDLITDTGMNPPPAQ